MLTIKELVELDKYIDRGKLADLAGINYQTLSSKITRFKNGQPTQLSVDQSESLEQALMDVYDKLLMVLQP